MRIISKKPDYYDSAQGYGIDKTLVYVRNLHELGEKEIPEELDKLAKELGWWEYNRDERIFHSHTPDVQAEGFKVLFCGILYRGIKLTFRNLRPNLATMECAEEFCYNTPAVLKAIQSRYKKPDQIIKPLFERDSGYWWNNGHLNRTPNMSAADVLDVVFQVGHIDRGLYDFSVKNRMPVVSLFQSRRVSEKNIITLNPVLKELKFFKVIDPYRAFQELSMFIGGVLPRQPNVTDAISDKVMAAKKGFDDWSFKTRPGTKKPRRKKK